MKIEYISNKDVFFENSVCDIRGNKEDKRFSGVLEKLKDYNIIKSYKEFADNINETSVGLNDIKKGRKKISVNHVKNINIKYPFINTDYILFDEGLPFHDDYLIAYHVEGRPYPSYYKFDLEAITNYKPEQKETSVTIEEIAYKSKESHLMAELLATKNELLEAKDKIMKLQTEIYELKLKSLE